jgi:hypothetical protein
LYFYHKHKLHKTLPVSEAEGISNVLMAPPPSKRRKVARPTPVEEVTFDLDARHDYLTGFHKRKLQRAKHAQEIAERKAKEEKREQRRKVCFDLYCISSWSGVWNSLADQSFFFLPG